MTTASDDGKPGRVKPGPRAHELAAGICYLASVRATYDAMEMLEMDWTAHAPVQGAASPKVIAYHAAAATVQALIEAGLLS